jgi:hypothetical protein
VPSLFGEDALGTDLRPVRELLLAGDRAGATARVPQPVADHFVAHGDVAACGQRLAEYRAAGVDLPVLFPMPVGGDWGYEEAIASFAPSGSAEPAEPAGPNGPNGPSKEAVPSARNL